jgi:hypothetical protein
VYDLVLFTQKKSIFRYRNRLIELISCSQEANFS